MKRHAINRLQEWKEDPNRLPLIIRGARQVGKTWLMQEFGRTAFERCAYPDAVRHCQGVGEEWEHKSDG